MQTLPPLPPADSPAFREADHLADSAWEWFLRYTHPRTGLTLDGGANSTEHDEPAAQASIASTGFYLGLLPVAASLGKLTQSQAADRALLTLRFASRSIDHVRGLLYHFVHQDSGKRFGNSEFSTLDTSIFLHGAIVTASAFGGEIARLSDQLLDRIQWDRLLIEDRSSRRQVLSYGFDGNRRLLSHGANVRSSENLMPAILAAGSGSHPVSRKCWYNMAIVRGLPTAIGQWAPPPRFAQLLNPLHGLFTAYYGLCWIDLHNLHDADGLDLWENARTAALFNREACRHAWAARFATYRPASGGWWGISAGDAPSPDRRSRFAYTVPNPVEGDRNGTVWPTAALASFPWIPAELAADLVAWKNSIPWPRACGPFGLAPFSLDRDWVSPRLLGIDLGSFLINWWNARTGLVHNLWKKHPIAARGLEKLEFSHP